MWAGSVQWEGAKTHILKIFAILRVSPSQQPGPGHPFAALSGTGAGHKRPDIGAEGGSHQVTLSLWGRCWPPRPLGLQDGAAVSLAALGDVDQCLLCVHVRD